MSPTRCTAHSDRSGLWLIRRELRPYGVGCAWFVVAMVFVPAVAA